MTFYFDYLFPGLRFASPWATELLPLPGLLKEDVFKNY